VKCSKLKMAERTQRRAKRRKAKRACLKY